MAELAKQLGKIGEHPKSKLTQLRFARRWATLYLTQKTPKFGPGCAGPQVDDYGGGGDEEAEAVADGEEPGHGEAVRLESVQQSHFGSRFGFWHFNLQIGAQMRRTVIIPHLKTILNTSKLKI